jgi:glycosyltransferase involved in cell wall biosynthesis
MISSNIQPIRVMRVIARMNVGGPAVQIAGLMRNIDSETFNQKLYTGYCAEGEADYLDLVATDVASTRISGFGRRMNISQDIKAFVFLVKEIRSFKPHIVHTHTAKAGLLGRIASIISLHPSIRIHTFHGHLLNGYFSKNTTKIVVWVERFLAIFTHQLLAVGERVRLDLLDAGVGRPEKFGVMSPGLKLNHLYDKHVAKEYFGLDVSSLYCAYIGRVTSIKRPDRFLDVVRELQSRKTQIRFFMAGDGELLEACRLRVEAENLPVTILGWQANIEMILSAADIVVLTSDNEGTPLSLIQAGMAGLPVVASDVGSVSEVIVSGKTGIVSTVQIEKLADAIEMLTLKKSLRQEMGIQGRNFTMGRFSLERLVNDHENLYRKFMTHQAKL